MTFAKDLQRAITNKTKQVVAHMISLDNTNRCLVPGTVARRPSNHSSASLVRRRGRLLLGIGACGKCNILSRQSDSHRCCGSACQLSHPAPPQIFGNQSTSSSACLIQALLEARHKISMRMLTTVFRDTCRIVKMACRRSFVVTRRGQPYLSEKAFLVA